MSEELTHPSTAASDGLTILEVALSRATPHSPHASTEIHRAVRARCGMLIVRHRERPRPLLELLEKR